MKFAICNEVFDGWELERAFGFIAQAGYAGVEIAPYTLARAVTDISSLERARVREAAAQAGLEICGLHWLLARTEGFHLTAADAATRRRTAAYLRELADFCADLGGKTLVLGSPQQRSRALEVSSEQAREWAAETLREGMARAEERGVVWCIEPLGPAETNFINTAREAADFASQLNSPAARIVLDVKAMATESAPITEIIREAGRHASHFHANDPNRKGPGFGRENFQPILAALRAVNYDGFVSVEVFDFSDGAERIATQSLRYLRDCDVGI